MQSNKTKIHSPDLIDIYLRLDEDFPYDIDNIFIRYNKLKNKVSVIDERIPLDIKKEMLKHFEGDVDKFVRFLEINLERIFRNEKIVKSENKNTIVDDESKKTAFDKKNEDQIENKNTNLDDEIKKMSIEDKKEKTNAENKTFDNDEIQPNNSYFDEETLKKEAHFKAKLSKVHNGPTNIKAKIFTDQILYYFLDTLFICVECNRCKNNVTLSSSTVCNCKNKIKVEFHHTVCSNNLGLLCLENCKFVAFAQLLFSFCCECGAIYTGKINQCKKCGKKMVLKVEDVKFIEEKKFKKKDELDGDGTCKHYKKSFRWFLFPCCNQIFPCDVCHDEKCGHVAELANIMVCGKCRKKQPVKKECECGMSLNKSSKFWEGGKGTRNKVTMSKKDSKKYKK